MDLNPIGLVLLEKGKFGHRDMHTEHHVKIGVVLPQAQEPPEARKRA